MYLETMPRRDIESLDASDAEGLAGMRPASFLRGRAAAALLLAAAACAAVAFQGFVRAASAVAVARRSTAAAMTTAAPAVGAIVGLDEIWAAPQQPVAAAGVMAPAGAPPSDLRMPPPESAALNTYFNEMMGVPSGAVATAHDGNACYDNEEEFQNLCYRKCSLLTNGNFSLRTSAWTCCQASDIKECFINNQDRNLGWCSGYDVGGDGKSCPHAPGKCLDNEELFLGECFQKCSILTNNTKPYRTSAFSCCKTKMALSCFQPSNVALNPSFTSGGGQGDGNPATPRDAHQPFVGDTPATAPVVGNTPTTA